MNNGTWPVNGGRHVVGACIHMQAWRVRCLFSAARALSPVIRRALAETCLPHHGTPWPLIRVHTVPPVCARVCTRPPLPPMRVAHGVFTRSHARRIISSIFVDVLSRTSAVANNNMHLQARQHERRRHSSTCRQCYRCAHIYCDDRERLLLSVPAMRAVLSVSCLFDRYMNQRHHDRGSCCQLYK